MRPPIAVILGALALAGCGTASQPRHHPARGSQTAASPLARAETTHEYPAPPAPAERAAGSPSPIRAITHFTTTYINWTAGDVARRMSTLARASVGQARSEMELAAAETSGDSTLRQGGIANQGVVESVAPLRHHPDEYVVVTRETTTATATDAYQGLAPAWHVTIATLTARGSGRDTRWVISGWQPES